VAIVLRVNGGAHAIEVAGDVPLLYVLRNDLGLRAAKYGCGLGQCGACKVLVDGRAVASCSVAAGDVQGCEIVTLEGLGSEAAPDPLQRAWLAENAGQCGYCVSGMLISARALLDREPAVDAAKIRDALAGQLCRCGSHPRFVRAILRAAKECER
jgi:nicotinate dehydrogenase subunit A